MKDGAINGNSFGTDDSVEMGLPLDTEECADDGILFDTNDKEGVEDG